MLGYQRARLRVSASASAAITLLSVLQVSAKATAVITLLFMLPCLWSLWSRPEARRLPRACAYAALCGFMFGFHVHEKASITTVLLLALQAGGSQSLLRCFRPHRALPGSMHVYCAVPRMFVTLSRLHLYSVWESRCNGTRTVLTFACCLQRVHARVKHGHILPATTALPP
jgi:ALG6, ALG8 glycosyltransferase family